MALPPSISDASVTLTFGSAGVYYGYCTIADVKWEFPNQASFTTLTNSNVAQAVTYSAQEMQNVFARLYTMPYTGTDQGILLSLRMMNARLAVSMLIARYFQGSEPDLNPYAVEFRDWAEAIMADVVNGTLVWSPPIGDAKPLGENVVYPMATAATVTPNPYFSSPQENTPIFRIDRNQFRDDLM